MDQIERRQSYLEKAKEAEQEAAKVKNAEQRTAWLKVAENYRQLAGQK
ncbi:MAG TPA: hypothetical protein VH019_02265 [Rhizomicrobium sp.]|jgi:hypothetical protein|nr:hypothetical protein [Rhizomicrobium sp.]